MHDEAWTNERVAMLRQLWARGATAATIADCLGGISRSAVLGKIFRLRLWSPDQRPAATTAPDGAPSLAWRRGRQRRDKPRAPASAPTAPPQRGKTLLELTNTTCRWPFGHPGTSKFHFCGAPGADLEAGMPYCEQHARRAYPNDPQRRDQTAASAGAPAPPARPPRGGVLIRQPFVFTLGRRRSRF
jgi:GcrA cell cycle regulator